MDACDRPIVVTLHTVLPNPTGHLREVTQQIVDRASAIVVLANAAVDMIRENFDVPPERVHMIPHGVPIFTRKGDNTPAYQGAPGLSGPSAAVNVRIDRSQQGDRVRHPGLAARWSRNIRKHCTWSSGETHPVIRSREGEHTETCLST